mmetsp:Transcript_37026/g.102185  ORF Transcript_37026/g.102185 Transcript_37026/m.102185 type:complete len:213 (+) Transcript_37026:358-996(+)
MPHRSLAGDALRAQQRHLTASQARKAQQLCAVNSRRSTNPRPARTALASSHPVQDLSLGARAHAPKGQRTPRRPAECSHARGMSTRIRTRTVWHAPRSQAGAVTARRSASATPHAGGTRTHATRSRPRGVPASTRRPLGGPRPRHERRRGGRHGLRAPGNQRPPLRYLLVLVGEELDACHQLVVEVRWLHELGGRRAEVDERCRHELRLLEG